MIGSILIIRPGAIGDFILSLPALEFLSRKAESTEVWCPEPNLSLIQFTKNKRSIVSAGLDRVSAMHCDDVLARLSQFDAIYSWYGAKRPEFRDAVMELPFHFFNALPTGGLHATEYYCDQVGMKARLPRIVVPQSTRGDFYILHPFASNPAKRWPLQSFQALAAVLGDVRWCAGAEDVRRHPDSIANAVLMNDLFELGQWISGARGYIGNDSGITHLAAAVGTPTVALFGPTDPAVWAPKGNNVRVIARRTMDRISPREVAAAVYDLI